MEKKRPHYSLDAIRQIVLVRRVNAFTATALVGAAQLGLSPGTQNPARGICQSDVRENGIVVIQFKEK